MTHDIASQAVETPPAGATASAIRAREAIWAAPTFAVLSLDCEITAYAPDGDAPLF